MKEKIRGKAMTNIDDKVKLLMTERMFMLKLEKYLKREITLKEVGDDSIRDFKDAVERIDKYNEKVLALNELKDGNKWVIDSPILKHFMLLDIYKILTPNLKSIHDIVLGK